MKSNNAIDSALEKMSDVDKFPNAPAESISEDDLFPLVSIVEPKALVSGTEEINTDQDIRDDYINSRNVLLGLIEQQQELIKKYANFLNTCPSPRAYEVMDKMMKTASELSKELLAVQLQLKEVQDTSDGGSSKNTGDMFFFSGGPSHILDQIKKAAKAEKKVIDITPDE